VSFPSQIMSTRNKEIENKGDGVKCLLCSLGAMRLSLKCVRYQKKGTLISVCVLKNNNLRSQSLHDTYMITIKTVPPQDPRSLQEWSLQTSS
jgi:hypothetical protein